VVPGSADEAQNGFKVYVIQFGGGNSSLPAPSTLAALVNASAVQLEKQFHLAAFF
jgi:hypothetical protein